MNFRIIKALLKKDFSLFLQNRFYMLMTIVGLVFYIIIFFIMPNKVDEQLKAGIYAPVMPPAFSVLVADPANSLSSYDSLDEAKAAVENGDIQAVIALPEDIMQVWASGGKPEIEIYYSSSAPLELRDAIISLVKELSYIQTGQSLTFDTNEQVMGQDMLGEQIPMRNRMVPLLAIFILMMEILSLASLIAEENEQGTARALLVTPMSVPELFAAKGIIGVGMALGQVVLFMLLVGGFSSQPLITLSVLILGSLMVTGLGFLLASLTKSLMSVTAWGMLLFIILAIPGMGIMFPGLISSWAKVIPSYYLTDTVNRVVNYGADLSVVGGNLLILLGFTAVIVAAGIVVLRRRYQ
ncbi:MULTISPECIES: ABC transporter permease [Dehalococcoides]|jgi:ABC-2 type transporter.|uniref:ABC transporter permease n=2 Tax=root TaxID=1 RepID=A0AB33HSR5_9CHLR|nr:MULTISPECIES: ABC transporter permease [Dehalococcoides]AQU02608.1 ABC transporter permease [Dehalococcoides mccartyi]AQU03944.1 ABC transporter permease [Dehalococcoides mccartyi]MEA4878641.1 ABC transporter permease [Dehalococcoides mccartyi]POZ59117.1 ABC-type multidrug transport system, permease component [Dehalococcoides mccartyi]BAZ96754.1 ABC transporter permease [Dehalococcoides mccartyi]